VSGKDQPAPACHLKAPSSLTTLIHGINILDKASPKTRWPNSEGLSREWVTSEAEPQEKDPASNQAKHFSTDFIPYVLKLSNNMSRTLTWNNCKIIHLLPQDRWSDNLSLNATWIYEILCECRAVYNVILGYELEKCIQKHQRDPLLLHKHS